MNTQLKTFRALALMAVPLLAFVGAGGAGAEAVKDVLLALVLILIVAKLGGAVAARLGQPEVLGELIGGILIGNLTLVGVTALSFMKSNEVLHVLSELGVILLMFEVGLETSLDDMMKVGRSSLFAALLGVIAPFGLGWATSAVLIPEKGLLVHAFIGAVLTATSVGITARVLKDSGKIQSDVGRIILGAAVIDDVLGLLVLAVMTGIIDATNSGNELAVGAILKITGSALGFLVGAIVLGRVFVPRWFGLLSQLQKHRMLLAGGLILCFLLSYLASVVGLAPIIGAFAAGLVIKPLHYEALSAREKIGDLETLVGPLTTFLVPVFFVMIGDQVDLRAFADFGVVTLALMLTVAAVIGKQACALGVVDSSVDKIAVGLGMIPRGEVGLIFASIGASLMVAGERVIDEPTFAAVVVMVVLTTIATPPLLKWRLERS